jgi:hypothetical protein
MRSGPKRKLRPFCLRRDCRGRTKHWNDAVFIHAEAPGALSLCFTHRIIRKPQGRVIRKSGNRFSVRSRANLLTGWPLHGAAMDFSVRCSKLSTDRVLSVDGEIPHIDFDRDRRDTSPHTTPICGPARYQTLQSIGAVSWPGLLSKVRSGATLRPMQS